MLELTEEQLMVKDTVARIASEQVAPRAAEMFDKNHPGIIKGAAMVKCFARFTMALIRYSAR